MFSAAAPAKHLSRDTREAGRYVNQKRLISLIRPHYLDESGSHSELKLSPLSEGEGGSDGALRHGASSGKLLTGLARFYYE